SELAAEPSEAAAQGQPRHASRRIDAERRSKSEGLRLPVEVAERRAGLHASRAANGIDPNAAHHRKIEQKTAFADGIAGNVVAAGAYREQDTMLARKGDSMHDVRGPSAAYHRTGIAVDHGIPDRAGLVVARLFRQTN